MVYIIPDQQPEALSSRDALDVVRQIAGKSENIITISHSRGRQRQRNISRSQIEKCIRAGSIVEGPYVDDKGNWRMNFYRHAAGEEMTCVVAIDWPSKLIVVSVFR